MSTAWWNVVLGKVNPGDVLFTPWRGLQIAQRKPFTIIAKEPPKIIIASGYSKIPIKKTCFDTIKTAFSKNFPL